MGKFLVTLRKNGEYQFELKAGNGQVILTSEGYSTKSGCMSGIESVRKNCLEMEQFEKKQSKNGKHHFNLKAKNGQVIGVSEIYETVSGMDNGIESVTSNAPDALVDDQS